MNFKEYLPKFYIFNFKKSENSTFLANFDYFDIFYERIQWFIEMLLNHT